MLFFSSNRPGGFGGKDLWYSVLDEKGNWAVPVNLGESINTLVMKYLLSYILTGRHFILLLMVIPEWGDLIIL